MQVLRRILTFVLTVNFQTFLAGQDIMKRALGRSTNSVKLKPERFSFHRADPISRLIGIDQI